MLSWCNKGQRHCPGPPKKNICWYEQAKQMSVNPLNFEVRDQILVSCCSTTLCTEFSYANYVPDQYSCYAHCSLDNTVA